ncbi:MAG TPA: extracellular solute-binding protein [Paenalcaligenes sp.]|nr:extracellular solute-binding protein [Paenalcaligenes sp.]
MKNLLRNHRWRTSLTTAFCAAAMGVASTAWAATEIQVWHALNEYNADVFADLVKKYNRSQSDVKVVLQDFYDVSALDEALAMLDDEQRPNLIQLPETTGLDDVATRSYIRPMYQLLANAPMQESTWYLPSENNFMHDSSGRLLALPLMAEIPVMFYNTDAFEKASIDGGKPSRAWNELQGQLVQVANNATRRCPITSDQPVSINLENLAAVNKQFYPGGAGQQQGFNFNSLYVRHLSTMISWVRSEIMTPPEFNEIATQRFAQGECGTLLSNSGNLGYFLDQGDLNFSLAGLPYYPQVAENPGNPFVTGSGLWATSGHDSAADQATASFITWLAEPKQAASWHEKTGFLPLTKQAFENVGDKYYAPLGEWKEIVTVYGQAPEATTRGFKVNNYHLIRAMFNQTIEEALNGRQTAISALESAANQANQLMAQR